jgi:regulatory protein
LPHPTYIAALKMLARRELSERQIRQRLARQGHDDDAVDDAIARLKADRSLDDDRVARALARHEVLTRRHGRARAGRQLAAAGIDAPLARAALDEVLGGVDQDALLESALRRRLRDSQTIDDEKAFQRLYRYLLGQGFESDRILRALKSRRK